MHVAGSHSLTSFSVDPTVGVFPRPHPSRSLNMPLAGESGVQGAESDEGVKAEQVGMSSDATTSDGASSTSTLLEEGVSDRRPLDP